MRRLLPLFFLLVILVSSPAFADHIYLIPNDGSGDNFAFRGSMNGHPLLISGGTPYDFFSAIVGSAPGSTFGGYATLFLYSTTLWIDGTPLEFSFSPDNASIFISPFSLPTNGKDFVKWVQVGFNAAGVNYDTGQSIGVGASAMGKISFYFAPDGMYYPGAFVQAPEPATLGLVGTGILLALVQKRRKKSSM